MSKKMIQKFMIGQWRDDGAFVPSSIQPEEDITDLGVMVAWSKKTYGEQPGTYSLIRMVPGNLNIVVQTSMFAKFGMPEDDDTTAPDAQG